MTFFFGDLIPYTSLLLQALWVSIYITLISFVTGSIAGVVLATGKLSDSWILRTISGGYIELFRNTPLLVQLYLLYFGLGQLGFQVSPVLAAIVGMGLNNAAYTAEIFRAGIGSVPVGLREAGSALALSRWQSFRYVVFKPALRGVIPSLTNQLIILFLFSSVASVISLEELTAIILNINNQTLRTVEIFTIGAVLYWLTSALIAEVSRRSEQLLFRW